MIMSSGTEIEDFTFMWEIKNFSMCPMDLGDSLHSTEFMPKRLDSTKWRLSIYPKGKNDYEFFAFYLIREMSGRDQVIEIDFSLTIKATDVSWQMSRKDISKKFHIGSGFGFDEFCRLAIINENRDIYLPNDTLTVSCYILCKDTSREVGACPEVSEPISKLEYPLLITPIEELSVHNRLRCVANSSSPYQSFCLTHIRLWSYSFAWTIRGIDKLQPLEKITCELSSGPDFSPPVSFAFLLGEKTGADGCAQIVIERTKLQKFFLRCNISVASSEIPFQISVEDEHLYNDYNPTWRFKPFLKLDNLKMGDYNGTEKDQITLLCKLTMSIEGKKSRHDMPNSTSSFRGIHPGIPIMTGAGGELLQVYQDRKFCDVTLRTEDGAFPAHKAVLCTRSSVFSAMFEKDMKEKNSGIVDITDVEAIILEKMLKFMYSGQIDDCCRDTILKLYYTADKYDVASLRKACSSILKSCLSVSNVCEVLTVAYVHYDQDLTKAAENFLFIYSSTIFDSADWKMFTENYPEASAETRYRLQRKTV